VTIARSLELASTPDTGGQRFRRLSEVSCRAALDGVYPHCLQNHMRHANFNTTAGYIQTGEAWSRSGLKGIFADDERPARCEFHA
jgi:hypothetical protein